MLRLTDFLFLGEVLFFFFFLIISMRHYLGDPTNESILNACFVFEIRRANNFRGRPTKLLTIVIDFKSVYSCFFMFKFCFFDVFYVQWYSRRI